MGVLKERVRDKDLTSEELATSEKVTGDSPNNAGTMSLSKGRCNLARQRALSQRQGAQGCLEFLRSHAGSSRAVLCDSSKTCFESAGVARPQTIWLPNIGLAVQKTTVDKGTVAAFPPIASPGRLVE